MDRAAPTRVQANVAANRAPASALVLHRKCACGGSASKEAECEDCKKKKLQRRADGGTSPAIAPPSVHDVLRSPGRPLDHETRSYFEPRFGHDFSKIRVHADEKAMQSARDVHALAYTVGNNVVFGHSPITPRTHSGRQLLAHELAHVVQHGRTAESSVAGPLPVSLPNEPLEREADAMAAAANGLHPVMANASGGVTPTRGVFRQPVNAPQPVQHYERGSVPWADPAKLDAAAKSSYWWVKVQDAFEVAAAPAEMNDPEQRDAVLSVLWQKRPAGPITTPESHDVLIPPRAGAAGSKALLYRFSFTPKSDPAGKDKVDITFLGEGSDLTSPLTLAHAPADFVPTYGYSATGFPNDVEGFWNQHAQEKKDLFYWVTQQGPGKIDRSVTVEVVVGAARKVRQTKFRVTGNKGRDGGVQSLSVALLPSAAPELQAATADYHTKDRGDFNIEAAQTQPDKKNNDKLGNVTIPATVPADEVPYVKLEIANYFSHVGTRNAEADAVIPIAGKSVFYTLRFRPNNDVDVERVGERNKDAKPGDLDPDKLDIARSPDYAAHAKDAATLAGWLKRRYPKASLKTPAKTATPDEVREQINTEADQKSDKPDWLENYGIKVLDDTKGAARLKSVHGYEKERVKDMKTFVAQELKRFEATLETMTDKVLAFFPGVRLTRQRMAIDKNVDAKKKVTFEESPNTGGMTLWNGGDKTIIIFDSSKDNPSSFLGGKEGVLPANTEVYAHELGHVVGISGAQDAFNKFVKKQNIEPITEYAAKGMKGAKDAPEHEFFPEAFALFQTDPEWMRTNLPPLYNWFDTLVKTGKPPKP